MDPRGQVFVGQSALYEEKGPLSSLLTVIVVMNETCPYSDSPLSEQELSERETPGFFDSQVHRFCIEYFFALERDILKHDL